MVMSTLMYTPHAVNANLVHFEAPNTGVFSVGPIRQMSAAHLNRIAVHFDTDAATFIGPQHMVRKVIAKLGDQALR